VTDTGVTTEYFKDARDVEVRVGDEVAYAVRQNDHAHLKVGVVLAITVHPPRFSWSGPWWRIKVKAHGGKTPGVLEHPDRIVKLRSVSEIEAAVVPPAWVFDEECIGDDYGDNDE